MTTVAVLVIDAVGVPTLNSLIERYGKPVNLPNLRKMGLFENTVEQASASPDSLVGHREMVGVIDHSEFGVLQRAPEEYVDELSNRIKRGILCKQMYAGLQAIADYGEEHERTGKPILYTSKCDPNIQIAMNEAVIPLEDQRSIVETAFALAEEMKIPITRVIMRPYVKGEGGIMRTANRYDVVPPVPGKTLIDILYERGVYTVAVGKTSELVAVPYHFKCKISHPKLVDPMIRFVHPQQKDTNPFNLQGTLNAIRDARERTFIFTNLADTDSMYGHTGDTEGAVRCIEEIDRCIPLFQAAMKDGDLLIVTSDHGMEQRADYGHHSKEAVPLMVWRKNGGFKLRLSGKTLADVGYIAAAEFGCAEEFVREFKLEEFFRQGS